MKQVLSNEFYQSEEFINLCRKFGIPHEKNTTDITIKIPLHGRVEIIHGYIIEHDYKEEEEQRRQSTTEFLNDPDRVRDCRIKRDSIVEKNTECEGR